jgi:acetylornithine deacetylase/succinyl-diaminopimelate desuccinylase-like protein
MSFPFRESRKMTSSSVQHWKEYFAKHRPAFEKTYADFLRFQTISADPLMKSQMMECARWMTQKLEASGCTVELWGADEGVAPVVFASLRSKRGDVPTIAIYNHYDVQPVDPLHEWVGNPFEPRIEGDVVFARGAQDNKGQCSYVLLALEAMAKNGVLPCHFKFVFDGEEETGSATFTNIIGQKKEQLKADYVMVVDAGMRSRDTPAISLGTRGLVALTMTITGTNQDLHSGFAGGVAYNPLHAAVQILAAARRDDGSIAIPGFYDEVYMPTPKELQGLSCTFDEQEWERINGQPPTGGERAFPTNVRNWLRPTFEINGIHGGYGGSGNKTVIPRKVVVKLSCRLVPHQDPLVIGQRVRTFLLSQAPQGVTVDVVIHDGMGPATRTSSDAIGIQKLAQAMEMVWKKKPEYILDGASIPMIALLKEISGGEVLTWGVGLPSDDIHAPNEHFDMTRMEQGFLSLCLAIELLGRSGS